MRLFSFFVAGLCCLAIIGGCRQKPSMKKSGGAILVYSLSDDVDLKNTDLETSKMASAILTRLDPDREFGIQAAILKSSKIKVSVPNGGLPLARAKQLLKLNGKLEFLITANARDHAELIEAARTSKDHIVSRDGQVIGRWVAAAREKTTAEAYGSGIENYVLRDGETGEPFELKPAHLKEVRGDSKRLPSILKSLGVKKLEMLMVVDPSGSNFSGKHLASVELTEDGTQRPSITFATNDEGANVLQKVTSDNLPSADGTSRNLAIILDDQVMSTPRILSTISSRGAISGNFSKAEAQLIVDVLRTGPLPFKLKAEPDSETTVGPTP